MKRKLIYAAFLLGIPILALIVTSLCEQSLTTQLRQSLRTNRPDLTETQVMNISIRGFLLSADASAVPEIRSQVNSFDMMQTGAKVLIAIALLFNIAIFFGGLLASKNRLFLLLFFRPGFYLSAIMLVCFTIVNAGLLIGSIYFGESYLINAVHGKLIIIIGIGAAFGVFAILKAMILSFKKASTFVIGKTLSKIEYPQIWDIVESLALKLNALTPHNIVAGLDPNFFVTEAGVNCLSGKLQGRTLYISIPLLRLINKEQFCGIIGHELGHFKGNDTKYSRHFYPIYRGLIDSLAGLENAAQGAMAFAILPTQLMLGTFLESFSVAENKLSRERELLADKVGVDASDVASYSSALVRIIAFAPYWQGLEKAAVDLLEQGKMLKNASQYYADAVHFNMSTDIVSEIASQTMPHPTDSHHLFSDWIRLALI